MSTTSKSKKSSRGKDAVDRPFAADVLKRARAIAGKYQVVLWYEDNEWYGRGVELPTTLNDGKTPEECVANVRETFVTTVAWMLEQGKTPPAPAAEGQRTVQMQIPLSVDERSVLAMAAKAQGFEGVAEFVRVAALHAATNS